MECGGKAERRHRFGLWRHVFSESGVAASEAEAQTIAYNLEFDREGELKFLEHIRDSGMAGLAFWPHFDQEPSREVLRDFGHTGFPVVLLDRYLRGLEVDAVVTDNLAVGRLLTAALIRCGHKRIAFLAEEDRSTSALERFEGFLDAHKAAGRPSKRDASTDFRQAPTILLTCIRIKLRQPPCTHNQ